MPASDQAGSRKLNVVIGFLILSLLAILPLATVRLPPILDYPNHMARMYLIAALPDAADLAKYYRIVWSLIPDLALDAVVPTLARMMPVEIAMRLVLAIVLLALAGGCLTLHRIAFRRWSLWPLFAFLLLYNRMFLWGFLNYLAGLALMLWALAAWVAIERRPIHWRILAGSMTAIVVYLAHLAAFGCYALAIVAYSLSPQPGEQFSETKKLRRAAPAMTTLIPAVIFFMTGPTSNASTHLGYGNLLRKFDLPVSIFDNYNRIFDGTTFAIMLIAVVVGLARRGILLHSRLRWSVLAVIIAFIVVPSRLLSASGIDHRLPIAVAFLFVATSDWGAVAAKRRNVIMGLVLVLLLARMTVIETVWLRADREYDTLRPMFDKIALGSSIAIAAPVTEVQAGGVPLYHFPTLAVIERHAFVDTIFADPYQQPLRLTDAVHPLWEKHLPGELWKATANGALPDLDGYDDLIVVDPSPKLDPGKLAGEVLFTAPRMILIHLSHTVAQSDAEPAK